QTCSDPSSRLSAQGRARPFALAMYLGYRERQEQQFVFSDTTSPFCFERRKRMRTFSNFVVEFLRREDGPTAVEYAVMLALIIVVCIGAITTLGTNANKTFTSVGTAISSSS